MPKAKIKVVDVINDIEDIPKHIENNIKTNENIETNKCLFCFLVPSG